MRQLEITGIRTVRWVEVPAPGLEGDGEALVRPLTVLIAGARLDPALVTSAVVGFDEAETALADPPTKLVLVP